MTPLITFGDGWRYFWRTMHNACSVRAALGFIAALAVFNALSEMLWAGIKGVMR